MATSLAVAIAETLAQSGGTLRRAPERVGQRVIVEDGGGGVAHAPEHLADGAGRLVAAVVAAPIGGLADAQDRGQRTIDNAHDLAEGDRSGIAGEQVAAVLAAPAVQDTVMLEIEQDELEELLRQCSRSAAAPPPAARPASTGRAAHIWPSATACYNPYYIDRVYGNRNRCQEG